MEFIISGNTSYTYLFVLISPLDNCLSLCLFLFIYFSKVQIFFKRYFTTYVILYFNPYENKCFIPIKFLIYFFLLITLTSLK